MVWWLKDWMAWLGWEYNDRVLMRKPPWPPDRWAPPPPALLPPNSCLSPVCANNTFKPGTFQKNTAACTSWLNCWYLTILRWYLLQKNGRNCHRSVFCFCCSQISSKLTDISESMRFSSKGFELVSLLVGSHRLSREEDEEGRDYWLETVSIFGCFDTSQQSKAKKKRAICRCVRAVISDRRPRLVQEPPPTLLHCGKTLGGRSTPGRLGSWHFLSIPSLCWAQKYMIGQNYLVRLFFVINDHTDILLDMLQNETIYLTWRSGYDNVFSSSSTNNNGCEGVMGKMDNNASNIAMKSSPNPLVFHINASLVCC